MGKRWSAELELAGAGGEPVDLWRTLASHGVADLAPNAIDEEERTLETTLALPRGRARTIRIRSGAWTVAGSGRMLRSPTVFEDVVKTVCTTNCAWSATVRMVGALVSELGVEAPDGRRAFPTPEAMAKANAAFYKGKVRAGYRGPYLRSLASDVAAGKLELEALDDPQLPDEEVAARLLELPGCGPYATAHMMMLLGRYSRLILDSWTRPKYARLRGRKASDKTIERRFRPYRDYAGLAFWLYLTRDWVEEP